MTKRGSFSSSIGFILAAAGSAVGLGNIWRFPYLAAKYGGGVFLFFYILFVVTVGFTLMVTEIAIGRKTGVSCLRSFSNLKKGWGFLGIISFLIPMIILPYYSVIGGWVLKYLVAFISGNYLSVAKEGYFVNFITSPIEPIIYQGIFIFSIFIIVLGGVKNGIERANKFIMPILVVLCITVAIYSLTLPGAYAGLKYYIYPDFSKFSFEGVLAALGQMFYSLSLAMGIMVTYGSYLPKESDIEKSVIRIAIFDTIVAVIAGFMVIPAVFAFSNGDLSQLNAGPSLMFITIPKVFESMGFSTFIGTIFFILVFFAALTSAISLMETLISNFVDVLKLSRLKIIIILTFAVFILGIPSSLGEGVWSNLRIIKFSILDFNDFITNSILMPICALITTIFIGYVVKEKVIVDEVEISSKFKKKKMYSILLKFIVPLLIFAILISSIIENFR